MKRLSFSFMKRLSFSFIIVIVAALSSCMSDSFKDNDSHAFLSNACIYGDTQSGYVCLLDGGGIVLSNDNNLEKAERGYFSFSYKEDDWRVDKDGNKYIDNARVSPVSKNSIYKIIKPLTLEEVQNNGVIDNAYYTDSDMININYVWNGYIDVLGPFTIFNNITGEYYDRTVNIYYSPEEQKADSLFLHICYDKQKPENWNNVSDNYCNISCDLSSMADIRQWNDSVVVVFMNKDKKVDITKSSKKDFERQQINRWINK